MLETSQLVAHVSLANGAVRFTDLAGKPLLAEEPSRKLEAACRSASMPAPTKPSIGVGQHQNAQMNLNGEDVELAQHNMDIGVPFVVSTRNYGVLWDNNGITRFGNPKPYGFASRDLKIRDAAGKEGGFTARYSIDGAAEARARREGHQLPVHHATASTGPRNCSSARSRATGSPPNILPNQTVTWEGTLESAKAGNHKFQLYGSSYFKVYVDGKLVLDRWRQNWAAWYHNFDVTMTAGKPVELRHRVDSERRLHRAAAQRSAAGRRAAFAHASRPKSAAPIDYYFVAGAIAGRSHRRLPRSSPARP